MMREIDMGGMGAIMAVIGGIILLVHWGDNRIEPGLVVGAVFIVSGLMLRIENAIRDTSCEKNSFPPAST